MKKFILLSGMALLAASCSSDRNDPETPKSVQDFTSAEYIKNTMVGTWKMTHTNYNGTWSAVNDATYESKYTFSTDNSYSYKPYTATSNSGLNQAGTFGISPASTSVNAKLTFNYTLNSQAKTRIVSLENYNNGVVEISESSIVCPSGTCKERFVKQ